MHMITSSNFSIHEHLDIKNWASQLAPSSFLPWRDVVAPDLSPETVASHVNTAASHLLKHVCFRNGFAVSVMRGGALMNPALQAAGLVVTNVYPGMLPDVVAIKVQSSRSKVLLLDVISDTGETLIKLYDQLKRSGVDVIVLCGVYITVGAKELFESRNIPFCFVELIGEPLGFVSKPMDIPYDFGEVAELLGLTSKERHRNG